MLLSQIASWATQLMRRETDFGPTIMGELAAAEQEGLLHGHREAQEKLKKESQYLRYLLAHHRPES